MPQQMIPEQFPLSSRDVIMSKIHEGLFVSTHISEQFPLSFRNVIINKIHEGLFVSTHET